MTILHGPYLECNFRADEEIVYESTVLFSTDPLEANNWELPSRIATVIVRDCEPRRRLQSTQIETRLTI